MVAVFIISMAKHIDFESLCSTPEANVILFVNYSSIKQKSTIQEQTFGNHHQWSQNSTAQI